MALRVPTTPDVFDRPGAMNVEWVKFLNDLVRTISGGGFPGGLNTNVQYNDNGVFGGIGNGTVGKVLTSNGVGVVPSFQPATETSPGGSDTQVQFNDSGAFNGIDDGTAGQVLTSNGAGVVPSFEDAASASPGGSDTQLQYNNATAFGGVSNGTAGHVLTSNGAAVLSSFQALPAFGDVFGPGSAVDSDLALFDGTSGKLLKDGGSLLALLGALSWVSFATQPLTLSEMQNLNSTPITIVTGTAGKILIPLFWAFYDVRGNVAWSATPTITLRLSTVNFSNLGVIALRAGANTTPATRFSICGPSSTSALQNDSNAPNGVIGTNLEVVSNSNFTGGGTGGAWTVYVAYGQITA